MSGTHAVLSPSKGEMILNCPAALGATKHLPNPPTRYAAEGTAYHEVASRVLSALRPGSSDIHLRHDGWDSLIIDSCAAFVGAEIEADGFAFTIDEENAAHAQTYVDAVRALGGQQFYEIKLDTSEVVGVPGQSGTGDAIVLDYENLTIHVADLKFGYRLVHAPGNKQLIQYALAAYLKYAILADWQKLTLHIYQPRAGHHSEHTYDVAELEDWASDNRAKFQRAYYLYEHPEEITPADFNPTEKGCEWCPLKNSCTARNQKMLDVFRKAEPAKPVTMSDADLAEARERVDLYEEWASSVKAEMHHRAVVLGRKFAGWKVVQGKKGNRNWDEKFLGDVEGELKLELGEAAYKPREIITPTQAQKQFKAAGKDFAVMASLITQAEGALSLVREDSTKPEVQTGAEFRIAEPV